MTQKKILDLIALCILLLAFILFMLNLQEYNNPVVLLLWATIAIIKINETLN